MYILTKIPTLPQRCHNIGGHQPTLRQCSGRVVWMLWQRHFQCWKRRSHNVQETVCEGCLNVGAQRWGPTFTQRSGNVV